MMLQSLPSLNKPLLHPKCLEMNNPPGRLNKGFTISGDFPKGPPSVKQATGNLIFAFWVVAYVRFDCKLQWNELRQGNRHFEM